ncbi:MAG: OadG family protein [Lachnospiraceae bacterium]|nr:OadG family protein [Lachnospiraceae bacterium]
MAESDLSYLASMYGLLQVIGSNSIKVDGSAFLSGITSFNSAFDSIGELQEIGEAKAEVSGSEIIVTVPVTGSLQNAEAEFIFSNDIFLTMEAAALNPNASMGDKMAKAALNTLMGMGTVFAVLILISLIISAMGFIPKLQNKLKKKAEKTEEKENRPAAVEETAAAVVEEEELSDDLELVAVIAAAIAASEGAASADGFVVRSIRKARR